MALTLHNYVQSAAYKRILAMRADLLDAKLDVGFVGEEGDYELYRRFEQEKARLFFVDLSRGSYMERITERALLIVPFFLFAASVEDKDKLAKLIHKVAGCFLADYRLPERNLDYPFFWLNNLRLGLRRKTRGMRRAFAKEKAIEGFIDRYRLSCAYRETILGGSGTIAFIKNKRLL